MTASAPFPDAPEDTTVPASPPVSRRRLLTLIAIPPTAWAVHEMACAAVSGWFCVAGHPGTVRATTLVLTVVGLVLSVLATHAAYRALRALRGVPGAAHGRAALEATFETEAEPWREMLAFASVLLGVVFTLGLVWGGLSAVLFGTVCEWSR